MLEQDRIIKINIEEEIQLKKANEEKLQSAKKLLQAGVSADIVA